MRKYYFFRNREGKDMKGKKDMKRNRIIKKKVFLK